MLREQLLQRAELTEKLNSREMLSQERYVLNNGVKMTSSEPLTEEQYLFLRNMSNTIKCLPKECFYNAQMITFTEFSGLDTNRVQYYEGYVWTGRGIMPVLHAWVTIDGKIADVTLSTDPESAQRFFDGEPPQEDLKDRVLGEIPEGWEYLGVPMKSEYIVSMMLKNMEARSLIDNWQDGWPLLTNSESVAI